MKKLLFTSIVFLFTFFVKAQCPANADGYWGSSIRPNFETFPPLNSDTSCWFTIFNFPANSKTYFFSLSDILIDSVETSSTGYGFKDISTVQCRILFPDFGLVSVAYATAGSCTIPLSGIGLLPVIITKFSVLNIHNTVQISWQAESSEANNEYAIQQSTDGIHFMTIYSSLLQQTTKDYSYNVPGLVNEKKYYRLKITSPSGVVKFSDTKLFTPFKESGSFIIPVVRKENVSVAVSNDFLNGAFSIYNATGASLKTQRITNTNFIIPVSLAKGIYYIRVMSASKKNLSKSFVVLE